MNKWTQSDENDLQRRITRKQQVYEENRSPLEVLIVNGLGADNLDAEQVVDFIIAKADEFRDYLLPFDSGARAARPELP